MTYQEINEEGHHVITVTYSIRPIAKHENFDDVTKEGGIKTSKDVQTGIKKQVITRTRIDLSL